MNQKRVGRERTRRFNALLTLFASLALLTGRVSPAMAARLDGSWTVSVNGQSVQVDASGGFRLSNISAADQFGAGGPGTSPDFLSDDYLRLVGHSTVNGVTHYVFSDGFRLARGQTFAIENLTFTDTPPPLPISLALSASPLTLTTLGQTTQIHTLATVGGGATQDVTPHASWTTYRTSNPAIATVNEDGLVAATGPGAFLITATNNGTTGVLRLNVVPGDPLTTVEGLVRRQNGAPVEGAAVRLAALPNTGTTDAAGHFSIPGVATLVVSPIHASVIVTIGDSTYVGEGSADPVPAGITDVGIIVVTPVAAVFETQIGTRLPQGDDTAFLFTFTGGFTFSFYGTIYTNAYVGSNGYITFGSGDGDYTVSIPEIVGGRPRISVFYDDLYPPAAPADGGVFVNQFPDRLVVTWNKLPQFPGGGSNTCQAILYSNGRIQYGYRGMTSRTFNSGTGLTGGGSPPFRVVDFTAGPIAGQPLEAFAQIWGASSPFDMDMGFLLFQPVGNAYNVQFVPPAPVPGLASIVGRVEDAQGHPLAGCRLEAWLSTGGSCEVQAQSGPDGSFRIDRVPLGGMVTVAAYGAADSVATGAMIGCVRPLQTRRTYSMRVTPVPAGSKVEAPRGGRQIAPAEATVAMSERPAPLALTLEEPRPNPFGASLITSFGLPRASRVSLVVYDLTGRRVATIVDGTIEPGWHRRAWNGSDDAGVALKSGVYFLRLVQGTTVKTRRVALIR